MPSQSANQDHKENDSKEENTDKVNSQTHPIVYTDFSEIDLQNMYKDIKKDILIERLFRYEKVITSSQLNSQQILNLQSCTTKETLITAFMTCFDLHEASGTMHREKGHREMEYEQLKDYAEEITYDMKMGRNGDWKSRLLMFTISNRLNLQVLIKELKSRAQGKEAEEKRSYTQASTPNLDINRAISGELRCFIKTVEIPKKQAECKIIVNIPIKQGPKILTGGQDSFGLLKATSSLNFYAYNNGDILPFSGMEQVDVIPFDKIRKHLSDQHKDIDQYYILDPSEWNEICNRIYANVCADHNEMKKKFYLLIEGKDTDVDHLNPALTLLKDSRMDRDITLSIYSIKAVSHAKILLGHLSKLNKLTIANLDGFKGKEGFELSLPDNLKNLETLVVSLRHCGKINLSNELTNINDISLQCRSLTKIDLSGLKNLKYIRVKGNCKWENIKLDESQNSVTFDFRDAKIDSTKTKQLIKMLEERGFEVLYNELNENSDEKSIQTNSLGGFANSDFSQGEWEYSDKPETLNKETASNYNECTKRICLMNHNGGINPSDYRKKVLTGIKTDEKGELVFTPYSFNADQSILVDLSLVKSV